MSVAAPARSTFSALAAPNYRIYAGGQLFAYTGMWVASIAQDWLVLQLTGSPAAVGVTMAMGFLPMLLFGMHGGALADRFSKRRILTCTQLAFAAVNTTLAVVTLVGVVTAWQVWVLALAGGFALMVDNPARQVFVHEIVPRDDVRNAIALNSALLQSTRLVGPALGAVLVAGVGAGWAFAVNAVCCAVPVLSLLKLRPAPVRRDEAAPHGTLREALGYVRGRPQLLAALVLVGTLGTLGLNFPIVLTAMAAQEFHRGAGTYGLFNVVLALGSVVGALYAARRTESSLRTIVLAAALFGVSQTAAALAPDLDLFVVMLVPMALTNLAFQALANSRVQLTTAPEFRGRVMGLYMLVFAGGTPIGAPIVGLVTAHWGARAGMALCGLGPLLAALAVAVLLAPAGALTQHPLWSRVTSPFLAGASRP
ncbi:MAG: MFS transporter [Motilibacteraceae bacterium]